MKTWVKILVGTVIIGGFTGVGVYLYRQAKLLYDYSTKIKDIKINSFTANLVSFVLYLEFTNKSDIEIDVTNQQYKIYINGEKVSDIELDKPVRIEERGSTTIPLIVKFNPKQTLSVGWANLFGIVSQKDKIKISTVGSLDIKVGAIKVAKLPVDFTYTLQELIDESKKES